MASPTSSLPSPQRSRSIQRKQSNHSSLSASSPSRRSTRSSLSSRTSSPILPGASTSPRQITETKQVRSRSSSSARSATASPIAMNFDHRPKGITPQSPALRSPRGRTARIAPEKATGSSTPKFNVSSAVLTLLFLILPVLQIPSYYTSISLIPEEYLSRSNLNTLFRLFEYIYLGALLIFSLYSPRNALRCAIFVCKFWLFLVGIVLAVYVLGGIGLLLVYYPPLGFAFALGALFLCCAWLLSLGPGLMCQMFVAVIDVLVGCWGAREFERELWDD